MWWWALDFPWILACLGQDQSIIVHGIQAYTLEEYKHARHLTAVPCPIWRDIDMLNFVSKIVRMWYIGEAVHIWMLPTYNDVKWCCSVKKSYARWFLISDQWYAWESHLSPVVSNGWGSYSPITRIHRLQYTKHLPRPVDPIVNCQFPAAFGKKKCSHIYGNEDSSSFQMMYANDWLANHVHKTEYFCHSLDQQSAM